MIHSIDYKLIKQPDTISEEIFSPNNNLISFIKNREGNDSRILVIKASNSSGKSFLLNSIAYAFRALELPEEELSSTLRSSLNYLIDKDHQKIDFEISINDPDGFKVNSKFNHLGENEIKIIQEDGETTAMNSNLFSEKYKLLYDIPENPLDRIYKLLKSIKEYNAAILEQLNPLDLKLRDILKSIKDERDDLIIKNIESRIEITKTSIESNKKKLKEIKEKLKNLENYEDLIKLNKCVITQNTRKGDFIKIKKELRLLKPNSKVNRNAENKKNILELKKEIKDLLITNLLVCCKEEITESIYFDKFSVSFSDTDNKLMEYLFNKPESVLNNLLVYDNKEISKFLKGLQSFKNISLEKVFKGLKSQYNEFDYKLIKDLKNAFSKHKENSNESEIVLGLFKKESDLILKELKVYENKLSVVEDLNKIQKELNNNINKLIGKINKGKSLSIKLLKEINKNKKGKRNDYDKKLERTNNIEELINEDKIVINKLRNNIEKNGIDLSVLDDLNEIKNLIDNLCSKNNYCKGNEKNQIQNFKKDIRKHELLLEDIGKTLLDDEVKLRVEDSKKSSQYAENQSDIKLFSSKLSFFTKYMVQRNGLISESGELKPQNSIEYKSYIKIIGEYLASLMGKKIIYQDKNVDIAYIDYTSKTPYFVTLENKKIAFSDFSGGQGSSNYLKAKLNIKEERKFIVLIDEIANMDNNSLNIVIDRLKELDNKNKLLLAILVEPAKEPKTFNIRAY